MTETTTQSNLIRRITTLEKALARAERTEAELLESRRALRTLLSNLPGIAYRCANTMEWPMEFISEGCLELTGYPADKLVGNPALCFGDLIHPEDRRQGWETVQTALAHQMPYQREYRIIKATGEIRWVWEKGRGVFASNQELVALEGFITDITQQKRLLMEVEHHRNQLQALVHKRTTALVQSEQLLRERSETLQRISDASPIGIALIENGALTWINDRMRILFAFHHEGEYLNRSVRILFASDADYAAWCRQVNDHVLDGDPPRADLRLLSQEGDIFDGHLRMCITDPAFPMSRAVLTISDISWRKHAEEERIEKEKLRGVLEMAGAVCHEMNQPLQELYLLIDEMQESDRPEPDTISEMLRNVKKIRSVTSKLMKITRYRTKAYIDGQTIIDIDSASDSL